MNVNELCSVLLLAHGTGDAQADEEWRATLLTEIRARMPERRIDLAYMWGEPNYDMTVNALPCEESIVFPLFLTNGRMLRNIVLPKNGKILAPLGGEGSIIRVFQERIDEVLQGRARGDMSLLLVAHGNREQELPALLTDVNQNFPGFNTYQVAYLKQEPYLTEELVNALPGDIVVVPVFIRSGKHVRIDIPSLLHGNGKRIYYTLPIDEHPAFIEGIIARIRSNN